MPYDATKNRYNVSADDAFGGAVYPITPGATDQLDDDGHYFKYVATKTAGDVSVLGYHNADGDTAQTFAMGAGQIIPLRVRRVTAATATVVGIKG